MRQNILNPHDVKINTKREKIKDDKIFEKFGKFLPQ